VLTHLVGGSAGREGAALQLGGSIGAKAGEILHLDKKDMSLVIMCGMSAVFAALFGTPLTATFFAMEVISVGVIYYVGLVPCIASSLVAYKTSLLFGLPPTTFKIGSEIPRLSLVSVTQVAIIALMCALVSILFCVTMKRVHDLFRVHVKNTYLRAVLGGFILIILTLIVGNGDYNGAGGEIITRAIEEGEAAYPAFLLKIIFTAVCMGAGFKGGEIVPTFFIGATFGCICAPLVGADPCFGAAIGLTAMFCAVVNCPIASVFLSFELFGGEGMILFAIACGVSYMLSGYYGLYSSQKIMYSKLKPEYININAK
jgi:H+/Cl- antiporter ClcA